MVCSIEALIKEVPCSPLQQMALVTAYSTCAGTGQSLQGTTSNETAETMAIMNGVSKGQHESAPSGQVVKPCTRLQVRDSVLHPLFWHSALVSLVFALSWHQPRHQVG